MIAEKDGQDLIAGCLLQIVSRCICIAGFKLQKSTLYETLSVMHTPKTAN